MALGEFTFSASGRERAATALRSLVIAQIVISVCLVIYCYNACFRVLTLLRDIERRSVYMLYGVILLHAYCMKLHYTMGLRLITLMMRCPHRPRVNAHCVAWLAVGVAVSLNGILITLSTRNTVKVLVEEMGQSLRVGITQYLSEPTWKRIFDTIQVELCCCGIERPADWYEIPWINMDFLNEDSEVVLKMAESDATILPPVAPFSCCNPRTLGPCYHDPIQQGSLQEVWASKAELVARSLHERGCLDALREPLERAIFAVKCFNVAVLIIQVGIVSLTQTLRTSARGAVLSGERTAAARGALFGCPAPPNARTPPPPPPPPQRREAGGRGGGGGGGGRGLGGDNIALLLLERRRRSRPQPAPTPLTRATCPLRDDLPYLGGRRRDNRHR